jgi:hypothetical protein
MDKLNVFISGTQDDMQPERDAISRAVDAVSLTAGIRAEKTLSQPQSPIAWIEEQLQTCDIYVGIYSHRYGWIIPQHDLSATELEFNLARQLCKPILIWIRELRDFEKDLPNFDRQQHFLERVSDFANGYLRQEFREAADLDQWVSQAIRELIVNIVKRKVTRPTFAQASIGVLFTLPGTHRKNPYFTPKPEVTAALRSFRPGDILVLNGPPGVGKTQHVVQHAQEKREQYTMVLWSSAESVQGLHQALAALADLVLPVDETGNSLEAKLMALREWLSMEPNWLLILDNADTVDAAREIERFIPSAHHGYVLVTSQFTDWTPGFRVERVEVWTEGQSSEFLAQRLPRCAPDKVNLARLGSELGYLPLALEHASAYILETGIPVEEYLDLLRQNRQTVLDRRYPGMTNYRASVTATWQLSFSRLGWLASYILHYAACLASEPIPRTILSNLLSASADYTYGPFERRQFRRSLSQPDAVNLALAELARYSLVTLSENTFRLHSLLQHCVLDSAVMRPWQARYWLCRMQGTSLPDWSLASAMWLQRTAHLLNTEGALPDYGKELATFNMRPFMAHLQALSDKTARIAPEVPSFRRGALINGIAPLDHKLRWFKDRMNWYQSGLSLLRKMLESNAHGTPNLAAETEWFIAHVEEFYKEVVETSAGRNLAFVLRRLAKENIKDVRHELYSFLNILARQHARFGDPLIAKRLFRFYIAQATSDSEALETEVAQAHLYQALSLTAHVPLDELQNLLEATLVLYERDDKHINLDVCKAVCIYARIATTPEATSRALSWIRRALPEAREYLEHRCDHACVLTEEYVRILGDSEADEALLACEETLRLALRARKLERDSVTTLWRLRGRLLSNRHCFLASARSYARCLALELQHDEPPPFQQIDLHVAVGIMFLAAKKVSAARMHLLKAYDLLEIHWTSDLEKAKDYGSTVGLALIQVQEEAKGQAMRVRALAEPQQDSRIDSVT